jgi:dTDP-4-amino-4,6-dideoxygalactose transaminase
VSFRTPTRSYTEKKPRPPGEGAFGALTLTTAVKSMPSSFITWCPVKPWLESQFNNVLSASLQARQLTNGGPLQKTLAQTLQELTGTEICIIPAASGTAALHSLCVAWSLKLGKKLTWATQAFTFPSAIQGPLSDSVVVDNDWSMGGPCLRMIEQANVDGVIVTNLFGMTTDILAYEQWCSLNNKLLIFDNAATANGFVNGRCIHDYGDGAFISLHETKPVGRGEGGAVFVREDMSEYVLRAMNFGFDMSGPTGVCRAGNRTCSNWRMSDIAAAAIIVHVKYIMQNEWISRFHELLQIGRCIAREVGVLFVNVPGLLYPDRAIGPAIFIQIPKPTIVTELIKNLANISKPIEAKQYYRPLAKIAEAPNAWHMFETTLCLPLHVDMDVSDVRYMLETVAMATRQR